jgi:phosphate butyryltransferase
MYQNFDEIVSRAKELGPSRAAVLFPEDPEVMLSVLNGIEAGLIEPVMVGNKDRIRSVAREIDLSLDHIELLDERDPQKASDLCLDLAAKKEVRFVVKGQILSSYPYRALVRKTKTLTPDQTSSSICFHQVPGLGKIFITTDPGVHILPDLETKKQILVNAIHTSRQLGCPSPRVMLLAADHVDGTVSPFVSEAEELRRFAEGGGLGPCHIHMAKNLYDLFPDMRITTEDFPDIFLYPNIETGNILCKSIDHIMMGIRQCIAVGAGLIILAPSRSDPNEVRMRNLALGPILTAPGNQV